MMLRCCNQAVSLIIAKGRFRKSRLNRGQCRVADMRRSGELGQDQVELHNQGVDPSFEPGAKPLLRIWQVQLFRPCDAVVKILNSLVDLSSAPNQVRARQICYHRRIVVINLRRKPRRRQQGNCLGCASSESSQHDLQPQAHVIKFGPNCSSGSALLFCPLPFSDRSYRVRLTERSRRLTSRTSISDDRGYQSNCGRQEGPDALGPTSQIRMGVGPNHKSLHIPPFHAPMVMQP